MKQDQQPNHAPDPPPDPAAGSHHTVGVGGWVTRPDGAVLLVRMTYGPSRGRLMLPGGHLDTGELLPETACREVLEETGVVAVPRGLLAVRQRLQAPLPNLYIVFWLEAEADTEPCPDGAETGEALWVPAADLLARDDLQPITAEIGAAWLAAPGRVLWDRPLDWQDAKDYRLWV